MACCFLQCSLDHSERNRFDKSNSDEESLISDDDHEKRERYRIFRCILSFPCLYKAVRNCKRWTCNMCKSKGCRKCFWCTTLLFFTIVTLIGLVLFVALPLVFKNSVGMQRSLIFDLVRQPYYAYNLIGKSYDQTYNCKKSYSNSHVKVSNTGITLGVWNLTCAPYGRDNKLIKPYLLVFHGEEGDRRLYFDGLERLNRQFNVIAFDYRSYGDSSIADLNEQGLVADSMSLYKWIQNQNHSDVFVMGTELGAAVATHVVSELKRSNIVPTGLILLNPFTSLSDKIKEWFWPLGKILSWMPWYTVMITDSLERNDLAFNTTERIVRVDCPILVMKKYYGSSLPDDVALAASSRDPITQGMVFLRETWWSFRNSVSEDDALLDFIDECNNFKKKGKI